MRYRILSPTIPELVHFVIDKVLPRGFYTPSALPVMELELEFEGLTPSTPVIINGQPHYTDSEGKVQFTIKDPSSTDYSVVIEYPTGGGERGTLQLREYVNLTWIVLESFIEAYNVLYLARRLMSITNTDIPVFKNNPDILSAGEDLDKIFDGANKFWMSALGGLYSPDVYPGIGSISSAEPHTLSLLQYAPDVIMYYYMERMIQDVFGIGTAVSFLPVNLNVYRMGLEFLIKDIQLGGSNPHIVWNDNAILQEFMLNNVYLNVGNTHPLPDLPTTPGTYLLTFHPRLDRFYNISAVESYSYQLLSDSTTAFVGYRVEESIVRAYWSESRNAFVTLTPILTPNYGVMYETGWSTFPIPIKKSNNEFVMSTGGNYGMDYIYIRGLTTVPYIPVIAVKVGSGGTVEEVYTSNRLLTDIESLSGVDVFVSVAGFNPDDTLYKSIIKTVWLSMEKNTYPSMSAIGWIGSYNNYVDGIIPTYMSVHKQMP